MAQREYPELLSDLSEQVRDRLLALPLPADQAARVGRDVAEHIRKHWGGQQIYIPRGDAFTLEERDLEIYRKFNGSNYPELTREYDLSEPHIRRVVNEVRRRERERRQVPMFPAK